MLDLQEKTIVTSNGFTLTLQPTQPELETLREAVNLPPLYDIQAFNFASHFSSDYNGGVWDIYEVSPPEDSELADYKGILMWPSTDQVFNVVNGGNWYSGEMQAITFGMSITILLLNQLLWKAADENCVVPESCTNLARAHDIAREAAYAVLQDHDPDQLSELGAFLD